MGRVHYDDGSQETMADFSPLEALNRAFQTWWLLALLALLGAVGGWVFHRSQPPIYQATVGFTVNVDYTITGPLSEKDVDQIQGTVGAFLISPGVMNEVITRAQEQGIHVDAAALFEMLTLERRNSLWQIYLRNTNPQTVFTLANIWGEVGLTHLIEAHKHAVQARAWQGYINTLANCVPYPEPPTEEFQSCRLPAASNIQQEAAAATAALEQEQVYSGGLISALLFEQVQTSDFPSEPVAFGQGALVFAGAMIGFFSGLVITNISWRKWG